MIAKKGIIEKNVFQKCTSRFSPDFEVDVLICCCFFVVVDIFILRMKKKVVLALNETYIFPHKNVYFATDLNSECNIYWLSKL